MFEYSKNRGTGAQTVTEAHGRRNKSDRVSQGSGRGRTMNIRWKEEEKKKKFLGTETRRGLGTT